MLKDKAIRIVLLQGDQPGVKKRQPLTDQLFNEMNELMRQSKLFSMTQLTLQNEQNETDKGRQDRLVIESTMHEVLHCRKDLSRTSSTSSFQSALSHDSGF